MDQLGSTAAMPLPPQLCLQSSRTDREGSHSGSKEEWSNHFFPLRTTIIFGDFDTVYSNSNSDGPDRDLSQNVGWLQTAETHSCCLQMNMITVEWQ